ncbi:MAG: DUF6519 domain-containing protein [Novosphingobium sp.]
MKGNISRHSFRDDRPYSGVFQVQGGMVTDADLGEQAATARARSDALGAGTAGTGVPAGGGVVDLAQPGGPRLVPGTVFAEGVRGVVAATAETASPLALLGLQADFPVAPALPASGDFFVYADVWERTVVPLEDPLLTDPGFHGAETALRQKTVAQLKFAPLAQLAALGDPAGPLPATGGGRLTANPVDSETIADECDPCADTVKAEQTVANALFRIEIVHVRGDPQAPERFTVAWSAENAAAIAPAGVNAEDFGRAGAVYETFSLVTETHLGVHHLPGALARSSFVDKVGDTPADQPTGPDGKPWPFLRRWDGAGEVVFGGAAPVVRGSGGISLAGRVLTIATGTLTARIDFTGVAIVAGDFWLIETRRFAGQPIRVVSETPLGIRHRFCPLVRVADGAILPLTDAEERRLSFPTLPDLAATHVRYDNACPKLYHGAENVQEALAALCDINAADIAFDPAGCPRLYDGADTVQAALNNLCKVDFGIERHMRLLMDWGVVCGVIPARVSATRISWSAGTILDRAGRLGEVPAATLDAAKLLEPESFHFDSNEHFAAMLRADRVCLALGIEEGGRIVAHLAPDDFAFGPVQPTFFSAFTQCRDAKRPFAFKEHYEKVPVSTRATIDKVLYAGASAKLAGSQRLDTAEQTTARAYNDALVAEYKTHVADTDIAALLDGRIAEIDEQVRPQEASGSVRETLQLQRETLVYQAVRETEEERIRRCLCDALLPRCPVIGEPPFLVPIACVRGRMAGGQLTITELCAHCCRKQALTWHTVQYFIAELRKSLETKLRDSCCPAEKPPAGPFRPKRAGWAVEEALKPDFSAAKLYQHAERSFDIFAGRAAPTEYRVNPRVVDLGIDQAKTALGGHGVEVTQTIDVGDAAAVAKLRAASSGIGAADLVRDSGAIKPGDKVALIVQDGVAVDYIKLDTGGSKPLFERSEATVDLDSRTATALAEFEAKLKNRTEAAEAAGTGLAEALAGRRREIEAVGGELTRLGESRASLAAELAALNTEVVRLRGERETIARDVVAVNGELGAVKAQREAISGEIAGAREEIGKIGQLQREALAAAIKERDEVVAVIRRETPVTAVVEGDTALAAALAGGGITNLDGLARLEDARLSELARSAGTNLNTARRIQREAVRRIERPIG